MSEFPFFIFVPLSFSMKQNIKIGTPRKVDKVNELHIVCIEAKQNQITHNTAIIENMNIYQTLNTQNYRIAVHYCSKRRTSSIFPLPQTHTHTHTTKSTKFINLSIETAEQQRSQAKCCIVLLQICNVECSFVDKHNKPITNDTKYRSFCFFPQVDRTGKKCYKNGFLIQTGLA